MFDDSSIEMDELIKSIRLYCRFFKISPRKMRDYLAKDSSLIKSGILEKSHSGLSLSDYIETYLAGISRMDIIDNFFNEGSLDNSLLLKDHIVPSKNIGSMLSLIESKKGANVLLYGQPGTGKTEFAKSLAKEVGLPIFFINQYNEDGEEDLSHRKSAIVASQNILSEKSIIVVDECDPIINTSDSMWLCEEPKSKNDSKAWINSILENTKHKIIWITNKTDSIDVSTKRRFSFSQEFKDLTKKQRMKVWEVITEKHSINFLDEAEKLELASKFKVNAGGISLAVQDVTSMKSLKKVSDKKRMLENILKQHERFVFGKVSKLVSKDKSYSSEILNLDVDPNEVFIKLKLFLDYLKENPLNSDFQNMNLLFYGPPGTGKTEFVKHLAENLGVEINLKRLSDIKSKWYGESLKNIASMFEEAEESGKILFLDEADSFFVDRESSNNENHLEETNELLTQMENFKGVLVCSTNMLESLDQAVLRRFTMKISFGYLENVAKRELLKKTFFSMSEEAIHESILKKVDGIKFLTPGDYKVVKQNTFSIKI
jgi:transitional endoplasmic reticulum ATPase